MPEKNPKFKLKTEYILIIALIAAIVLAAAFAFGKTSGKNTATGGETERYVSSLENKLQSVISGIKGAGKSSVVITVDGAISSNVAVDEKTVEENGRKTTTVSTVMSGGKPVILGEKYPEITGVLVVAKGADDITVKMAILNAVTVALGVNCNKVQILAR